MYTKINSISTVPYLDKLNIIDHDEWYLRDGTQGMHIFQGSHCHVVVSQSVTYKSFEGPGETRAANLSKGISLSTISVISFIYYKAASSVN